MMELRKMMTLRSTADWQRMARKMRKITVRNNNRTVSSQRMLIDQQFEPEEFTNQLNKQHSKINFPAKIFIKIIFV